MLVRAQAASNWRDGLHKGEREMSHLCSTIAERWKLEHIYISAALFTSLDRAEACRLVSITLKSTYTPDDQGGKRVTCNYNYPTWKSMIHRSTPTNRNTVCLLVVSVQAVDQYRKDPRLNQVIYGRITVTGQQLPTKTKRKQKGISPAHRQRERHTRSHSCTDTNRDTQKTAKLRSTWQVPSGLHSWVVVPFTTPIN